MAAPSPSTSRSPPASSSAGSAWQSETLPMLQWSACRPMAAYLSERRNYKSVVDAIGRMMKSEGVGSLWRGSSLMVNRAMIVTVSELATYDQVKERILGSGAMADRLGNHVTASFAAGIMAAVASNPVDVVKMRVMNMEVGEGVKASYDVALDCVVKTVRGSGVMALYKGFIPMMSRQGPYTVVLFVTLEQVRNAQGFLIRIQ